MTDAERKAEECRLGQEEPPEKESNVGDARQTSRRNGMEKSKARQDDQQDQNAHKRHE